MAEDSNEGAENVAQEYEIHSWKLGTPRGDYVLHRRLKAVFPLLDNVETLLDIGCGPATMSQHFRCRTVGCDISLAMLNKAKERIFAVVLCDALHLPFKDRAFDRAFESSCLYLLANKVEGLREMLRVSTKGIVTFESNSWSLRRLLLGSDQRQPRHPSPLELEGYYKLAGLKPRMSLVGFAPFCPWRTVFGPWAYVEHLIEIVPILKYFCGGILAYAGYLLPRPATRPSFYSRLVLHPTMYVPIARNWLLFGLVLLPLSFVELLRYLIRVSRRRR